MNIKRIFDIMRCKKTRYTVTLRHAYKGQTRKEAMYDLLSRTKIYDQHFKIKHFITALLVALTQLYVDIAQWLNTSDETANRPAESLLWADVEPEAIPYISFL